MSSGWESLLLSVKSSILHGSKEVSLAAINCLQSTVISHSPKVKHFVIAATSIVYIPELKYSFGLLFCWKSHSDKLLVSCVT